MQSVVVDSELKSAFEYGRGIRDLDARNLMACAYVKDLTDMDPMRRHLLAGVVFWEAGIELTSTELNNVVQTLHV